MNGISFDQAEINRRDFANDLRTDYPDVNSPEVQELLATRYAAPNGLANLRVDLIRDYQECYPNLTPAQAATWFEEAWQWSQGNFELLVPLVLSK